MSLVASIPFALIGLSLAWFLYAHRLKTTGRMAWLVHDHDFQPIADVRLQGPGEVAEGIVHQCRLCSARYVETD